MVIWLLRGMFVLVSGSIGYTVAQVCRMQDVMMGIVAGVLLAMLVILLEAFFSGRQISSISAIFFGLLIGFILARFFTEAVYLAVGPDAHKMLGTEIRQERNARGEWIVKKDEPLVKPEAFRASVSLIMTGIFCYLGISIFYQTRDRFRFIIPYVEFRKDERGARPFVLDTSVIIDGRIADMVEARFLDGPLVIPRFVLAELQAIADSSDRSKRNRGRRGLDVLNRLRRNHAIEVSIRDAYEGSDKPVDTRLIDFANAIEGRVMTTDYNLIKIAQIQGVDAANLNDLANALRAIALPGDELSVELIKPGEETGQAVGYLDDGTMVVAEHARDKIGSMVNVVVTRVHQTVAGHMVFCKVKE